MLNRNIESTVRLYEGDNLKVCSWNALIEELYTEEEIVQFKDNPEEWFNHWGYLKALEDNGKQVLIHQSEDYTKLTIQ